MNPKARNKEEFLFPKEGMALGLNRELIWSWNQLILRNRFAGTPAGFSTEKEQLQAFQQWEIDCNIYRSNHEYSFSFPDCPVPDCFAGRNTELEQLHTFFADRNLHSKVLLHGMGGIGKTTLAMQYAHCFQKEYNTIVFLSYHTDLQHTICDDEQLQIANLSWHPDRFKNQTEYFKEKWKILCQIVKKQQILLILDDMNRLKDKKLSLLWELPCDVMVTSRIFDESWPVSALKLQGLDNEQDWNTFYQLYNPAGLTSAQLEHLYQYRLLIQGNTLLMRLAVCNPALCVTVNTSLEPYFLRTSFLNSTDIQALRYLSLLPVSGMEKSLFLPSSGLQEGTLQKLIKMSLVWQRIKNNEISYGLHPVIAESVRHYYKPTPENCSTFLTEVGLRYANIWNSPFTEVSKAIPICLALLSRWSKPRAWMADTYDSYATVLWIGGFFEESLQYMMALYRECIAYYGEIHQVTGSIALRVAAVYHNSLCFDEAWEWTDRALNTLYASKPYNILYDLRLAQAAHRQCRNKRHQGLFEEALHYEAEAEQAMEQYLNTNSAASEADLSRIYFMWLEKAKILCDCQQFSKAEALCHKIKRKYLTSGIKRYHFLVELDIFQAELQLKRGQPAKAIRLIESCLAKDKTMRGDTSKDTLACSELLADAYAASGRQEEANALYHEVMCILTEYYPLQKNWMKLIKSKQTSLMLSILEKGKNTR